MSGALDADTKYKLDTMVTELVGEFGGRYGRADIEALVADSVERLAPSAAVAEFLPILAYRFTRERLGAMVRASAPAEHAECDVVFVSLSGGGRGQLAAALTSHLSGGRVAVHSAGTAAQGEVDPAVQQVIGELGVDVSEAFARPLADEVLRAADVIVTMGHSVGAIEIPAGVRHEDWRIGDPSGASVDEVRRVRDDIERRVRALLEHLGIAIPD